MRRAERDQAPIVAHVTPHTLRRTYITFMLAAGFDVPYVQDQVGHADPTTTLAIYARVIRRATAMRCGPNFARSSARIGLLTTSSPAGERSTTPAARPGATGRKVSGSNPGRGKRPEKTPTVVTRPPAEMRHVRKPLDFQALAQWAVLGSNQ